jgi:hypothetical protein
MPRNSCQRITSSPHDRRSSSPVSTSNAAHVNGRPLGPTMWKSVARRMFLGGGGCGESGKGKCRPRSAIVQCVRDFLLNVWRKRFQFSGPRMAATRALQHHDGETRDLECAADMRTLRTLNREGPIRIGHEGKTNRIPMAELGSTRARNVRNWWETPPESDGHFCESGFDQLTTKDARLTTTVCRKSCGRDSPVALRCGHRRTSRISNRVLPSIGTA